MELPPIQPSDTSALATEAKGDIKCIIKGMQDGSLAKKYKAGSTSLTNGAMYGGMTGFVIGAFTGKKIELTIIGIIGGAFLGYINSQNKNSQTNTTPTK